MQQGRAGDDNGREGTWTDGLGLGNGGHHFAGRVLGGQRAVLHGQSYLRAGSDWVGHGGQLCGRKRAGCGGRGGLV